MRADNRQPDQLRPIRIERRFTTAAAGSVLIEAGSTKVLCTASVEPGVPAWLVGQQRGWVTAEYSMVPGSTSPRKRRERGANVDGRTSEEATFTEEELAALLRLARGGIGELTSIQRQALGDAWPFK